MRRPLVLALGLLAAAPAAAQTPAAAPAAYAPAPWWMREPVAPIVGHVRTEVPANRARFSASFEAVERNVADAQRVATDKVRSLGDALRAFGPDKVRVETTFSIRPIYEQYRDKEGRVQENRQPDQIERYQVAAQVGVELRDTSLTERVYSAVLAARPSGVGPVSFQLEPDNATRTELYGLAVADAARRARLSVEGAGGGARLGAVRLIDPSARACETDVLLAGAPRGAADPPAQDVMLSERRMAMAPPPPPPPPPAPGGAAPLEVRLPLQVPLQEITARVCVIYALQGG